MEQASIAAHLGSYTAIVRDMAVLRELIQTSTQIITQAFDAKEDVQTLVDDAERRIFSLAERRLEGSALPVGKILKNTFEYIERLYERKEHVTGVATGFEKLDLETVGLPALGLHHHRRPTEHGKDGLRAEHRAARRRRRCAARCSC